MIIVYCDKCGKRVSEKEVGDGLAVQASENVWYCGVCAPAESAATKPTQSAKPVASGVTTRARKGVTTMTRRAGDPAAASAQPQSAPAKWLIPALAGGGVLLLAVALILLKGKSKPAESRVDKPEAAPAVATAKEKPRAPTPEADKPASPTPTVTLGTRPIPIPIPSPGPTAPDAAPTPPTPEEKPPQTQAERQRQAEKEMESYRDHRARTLLEEAQAWNKQNAGDPWTYQAKLKDISKSYGSAPAAAEARKILEEMPPLPPPPDRLELAAAEAKEYQLVYDLDLATAAAEIKYGVDNRAQVKAFDRIAYFMELQKGAGEAQYLYVSMDAFTTDVNKIGVPAASTGAHFQQNVANMNVFSNVKSIVTGTGLGGGNIEFWASNYGGPNAKNVPNAGENFDFGDTASNNGNYGSMQVHNHDAKQTLFAFNHWVNGGNCDLGIGNNPGGHADWTFANNAGTYRMKRLRVLVKAK